MITQSLESTSRIDGIKLVGNIAQGPTKCLLNTIVVSQLLKRSYYKASSVFLIKYFSSTLYVFGLIISGAP